MKANDSNRGAWRGGRRLLHRRRLALGGLDVSFIGREKIAADVARHGIKLSDLEGWKTSIAPGEARFSTKPAALAKADIVLVCVKSTALPRRPSRSLPTPSASQSWSASRNGMSNIELLKRLLPSSRCAGVVPSISPYRGGGHWHKGVRDARGAGQRGDPDSRGSGHFRGGAASARQRHDRHGLGQAAP
jgi:2-dehydropantoate 2-reductase